MFAVTTRGLETLSAAEIDALRGVEGIAKTYRRVNFSIAGSTANLSALLSLRTVDDVFLKVAEWQSLVPQRIALETIRLACQGIELSAAAQVIARLRPLSAPISFSVTVNFVGKRNYTADEVKAILAEEIARRLGWRYGEENDTSLNLRIFIEQDQAILGLRLSDHPMHSRVYKQAHIAGSLKPSVAAAMLLLVDAWNAALILDPLCGAGTIVLEAAALGMQPIGADLLSPALTAAVQNAHSAQANLPLIQSDVRSLPFAARSVDFVVSNLPWGRQVTVDEDLSAFYLRLCAEMERVLIPQGRIALLTSLPELLHFQNLRLRSSTEISLFGQQPAILVFER